MGDFIWIAVPPLLFLLFLAFCRTSTLTIHDNSRQSTTIHNHPRPSTTIHTLYSLPDLNHDQPRPVFAAGSYSRPAMPNLRCRISSTTSHAQCSLPDSSTTSNYAQSSLPDLNHDQPRPMLAAGPQQRAAMPNDFRRTSTTTNHAQYSLPDLKHDQPRPVFAAGPQQRAATPSVRCRTSTTTSHAQC